MIRVLLYFRLLETAIVIASIDDMLFRLPERNFEALSKYICQAERLDITTAHYSLLIVLTIIQNIDNFFACIRHVQAA